MSGHASILWRVLFDVCVKEVDWQAGYTKEYIFIPKELLKDNVRFDNIEYESTDEGYLIKYKSIQKKDTMGTIKDHRVHLSCIENNVNKRLMLSNVHTFDNSDVELKNHLNHEKGCVHIKSIKM